MGSAIVVDCRSRDLQVFAASVTVAANRGLVLRRAAELGTINDLSAGFLPQTVILLGGYAAQSSGGFVQVLRSPQRHERFLAGAAGLGWEVWDDESQATVRRGDGLRPITARDGQPHRLTIIVGGCAFAPLPGHKNSNGATAHAALEGLALRAALHGEVVLAEGQSDYVRGWAFRPNIPQNGLGGDFPAEHREDLFSGLPQPRVETGLRAPAVKRVRRVAAPPPAPDEGEFVEVQSD